MIPARGPQTKVILTIFVCSFAFAIAVASAIVIATAVAVSIAISIVIAIDKFIIAYRQGASLGKWAANSQAK